MADTAPPAPTPATTGGPPGSAPPPPGAPGSTVPPTPAGASANGALPTAANLEKAAEAGQRVYENTYRVGPDRTFPTAHARKLAAEILEKRLTKVNYAPETAAELTKVISAEIVAGLKALNLDRYKYVADVTIGEFKGQGIRSASRALWDSTTDSFASATFKNASLFCVAVVFGVYFE
ncbi:Tctex1 domain-containing protein 3 [Allomyces arbusculus]|nr:Tctex1 domain-containing protein 3 [Allomyces arbusculus]